MKPIRVCIVGPSRLHREGLKQLLNAVHFAAYGEGGRLADVLDKLAAPDLPDFVLWSCDSGADIQADLTHLSKFRAKFPAVKFIAMGNAFTRSEIPQSRSNFVSAVQAGLSASLSTEISGEGLKLVLELVQMDQRMFPVHIIETLDWRTPDQAAVVVTAIALPPGPAWTKAEARVASGGGAAKPVSAVAGHAAIAVGEQTIVALSDREAQVLRGLANGFSNKMIARNLAISEATVKVHVKALMRKIRASNRTQAAIWAMNHRFHEHQR